MELLFGLLLLFCVGVIVLVAATVGVCLLIACVDDILAKRF